VANVIQLYLFLVVAQQEGLGHKTGRAAFNEGWFNYLAVVAYALLLVSCIVLGKGKRVRVYFLQQGKPTSRYFSAPTYA
jgi:hypothetical protein